MAHPSRHVLILVVGTAAIAGPIAAAGQRAVSVSAVAEPVQAIREQIVAIDGASGRGTVALPMTGIALTGTGLIVGQIVDAGSGAPVANAIVAMGMSTPPAPVVGPGRAGAPPAPPPAVLRQLTDADGRFAFRHLPRGSYSITATRPGYVDGAYGRLRPTGSPQPLQLGEGERRNDVKVRVFRFGAITGAVREENGDPAVGANVRVYRRTVMAGRAQLVASTIVQTDDRGIYRLGNLTPGEYVVAVPFSSSTSPAVMGATTPDLQATMIAPGSAGVPFGFGSIVPQTDRFVLSSAAPGFGTYGATLDSSGTIVITPTTYFPSALVASQAQAIAIGSGEERAGVDIVLRSVPSTFIAGRLTGPDGPVPNWALHLVASDTGELSSDPQVASAITDADGSFMFLGIPAGSYVIQTVRTSPGSGGPVTTTTMVNGQPTVVTTPAGSATQPAAQPTLWTATPIAVGPEGLRDLSVVLQRGLRVSGRVEFDGSAERPPAQRLQTVNVMFDPADGRQRAAVAPTRLDANGQFTSVGLLPGKYVVRVTNPPGGWSLKSIMLGATDVADLPLEIDARDIGGLVVTFVDRSTEIQGSVRGPQGKPDDEAAVGVFPIDTRLWTNAGAASRRLRLTRATTAGTYSFVGLPAGEYGIVAFSEEFAGEWPDARFLEQLSRSATRVALLEGGRQSVDLARQTVRGDVPAPENTSGMFFVAAKNTSGMFFEAEASEPNEYGLKSPDHDASESAGLEKLPGKSSPHTRRVFSQQRDARVEPVVAPSTAATISGTVTLDDATNQPVRRARVSLRAPEARFDRTVMTDDAGRFVVGSLPPGRYSVIVTKPSFLAGYHRSKPGRGPGTAVAVTAGQKIDVGIKMARGAVIAGIVRDESGAPLPNARVTAGIIRYNGGVRDIFHQGSAQTDDRGAYRIFGLPANNYYVFVVPSTGTMDVRQLTSDDWQVVASELRQSGSTAPGTAPAPTTGPRAPSGRPVGYAPIFYPGALTSTDATPVAIAAGQEMTSVDLTARLLPTARIEGAVTATDGRPLQGALLMMFPQEVSTGFVTSMTTQQDGRFASPFVPPGRYTVYVRGNPAAAAQREVAALMEFRAVPPGTPPPPPPPPSPQPPQLNLYAEQTFDLSGESMTGVSIVVQEGVTVSGRVQFEGSRTVSGTETIPVRISMTSAVPTRFSFGSASTSAAIGGAFTIPGVPPGKMRFAGQAIASNPGQTPQATAQVAGWLLKSAIVNGRDVLDLPLDVTLGRNIDGAVVTFTDRLAELSGAVLDKSGAPHTDLFIMLLPADRAYWDVPSSRRFRPPTTPGIDGRYRFPNLPPGEYLLVALADADGLDMSDRTILEQLAAAGLKITIADGEKKVQDIRSGS